MNTAIQTMLKRYSIQTSQDAEYALKEILQEIVLLGLWRAKFFEHACFYGDTALRILYQLDRFSEDLDFSLLKPNPNFNLSKYHQAVQTELTSFGFKVDITQKAKTVQTTIQSAFIKADSQIYELAVTAAGSRHFFLPKKMLKIKFEVDTNPPPLGFTTETRYLLQPTEFFVKTMTKEDLFGGKLHAILCRAWKTRVKGRDWYDLIWFIKQGVPVRLSHLESRLRQTGKWPQGQKLTEADIKKLLSDRIHTLDIPAAKHDIAPFVKDPQRLEVWSEAFFEEICQRLLTVC